MNKRILTTSLTGLILGLMFSFSAAANTSVQSNHTAASATATTKTTETTKDEKLKIDNLTASQAEMFQTRISEEVQKQIIDHQQQTINWWLTALGVFSAFAGIVLAVIGILIAVIPIFFYRKEKQQLEQNLKQAKEYVEKIKEHHDSAKKYTQDIAEIKQWNPNEQNKEAQTNSVEKAKQLSTNEEIPIIEQLRAQAILLSEKADQSKNYESHLQAFYAWQAVLQQNYKDEQACFNAGLQAHYLHKQGNRTQQIHWFPEIEKYYRQTLDIKPVPEAAYNWGIALDSEAQALVAQNKTDAALEKWRDAGEKFQQTLAIKYDDHEAAHNWLTCLSHEYHTLKDDQSTKAQAKLQQARDLVNGFLSKNPQHKEKLAYNHACIYALEGNAAEAVKQLRLAQQIDDLPDKDHIETDSDFNNIRHTPEFQTWFKEAFPESSAES